MAKKTNTNRAFNFIIRNTKTHAQIAREEQQRLQLRTNELLNKGLPGIIVALDEWINELEILIKGRDTDIELLKDKRKKGIELSKKDSGFERSYYQALRNREEFSKYIPYPVYWRLSLFVPSIEKLFIALRRKNMPYAAEDIVKRFLSMLHAWEPKDGKKPPKTNFTIQEIEDIISAIEWSNPAPPNKNRIDHRMDILESLGDKIYVRNLRDFRNMVENAIDELQRKQQTETKGKVGQAYIPYMKAIELSNGILTRKKLDKAIERHEPMKVRSKKPSKQRRMVHIQDVLSLINKLSANEKVSEEATRMFGEWRQQYLKKRNEQIDLS